MHKWDFLGEMALISGQTATATVRAAEPMRVFRFDRDALAQLARTAPEVGRALTVHSTAASRPRSYG